MTTYLTKHDTTIEARIEHGIATIRYVLPTESDWIIETYPLAVLVAAGWVSTHAPTQEQRDQAARPQKLFDGHRLNIEEMDYDEWAWRKNTEDGRCKR